MEVEKQEDVFEEFEEKVEVFEVKEDRLGCAKRTDSAKVDQQREHDFELPEYAKFRRAELELVDLDDGERVEPFVEKHFRGSQERVFEILEKRKGAF